MRQKREGIRNLSRACLVRERIGDGDAVAIVGRRSSKERGDISWAGGSRFILQALVVGLDLVLIDSHLDLARKSYVQASIRCEWGLESAKQQNAQSWISA